ncbi:GerAB/ArcD/ProY family transporter [Peribacillus asahii]|uniref:GerAB/ArcD/ProY family transporter n=1 Tax=Peribacillus asahii TaxID=228899 RepID=UPI00207AC3D8|nr:endospore germination permease [Peribacillus asahii]USK71227.1 endospore germination permease [Peribacillus asahii]
MKRYDTISIVQISFLFTTAIGLKNHVTVIPHLVAAGKRDAWISVLFALVCILIWGFLIKYIHKATAPHNIFEWIGKQINEKVKWFISIPCSLLCVFLGAVTLKEMVSWTSVTYLPFTPIFFLIALLVGLCLFLAMTSLQTIVIVNTLVLIAIVVFGFFVAFANLQFKDYSLLKPILEHGFKPVIEGVIFPLSGLVELIAFLFLQHKVHGKITYKAFLINALILAWLIFGPLTGSIIEFGPTEAARQKYPAFEEWGIVTLGRFIEHVDFLSIYQWITGALIRITFFLFISIEVLALKDDRKRRVVLLIYSLIIIILSLLPMSEFLFHRFIGQFIMPITFWFFLFVSILLGLFVFIKNRTKRRLNYVQDQEETTT